MLLRQGLLVEQGENPPHTATYGGITTWGGQSHPLKGGARLAGGVLPFNARRAAIARGSPRPPPPRRGGAEGGGVKQSTFGRRLAYPKPLTPSQVHLWSKIRENDAKNAQKAW